MMKDSFNNSYDNWFLSQKNDKQQKKEINQNNVRSDNTNINTNLNASENIDEFISLFSKVQEAFASLGLPINSLSKEILLKLLEDDKFIKDTMESADKMSNTAPGITVFRNKEHLSEEIKKALDTLDKATRMSWIAIKEIVNPEDTKQLELFYLLAKHNTVMYDIKAILIVALKTLSLLSQEVLSSDENMVIKFRNKIKNNEKANLNLDDKKAIVEYIDKMWQIISIYDSMIGMLTIVLDKPGNIQNT